MDETQALLDLLPGLGQLGGVVGLLVVLMRFAQKTVTQVTTTALEGQARSDAASTSAHNELLNYRAASLTEQAALRTEINELRVRHREEILLLTTELGQTREALRETREALRQADERGARLQERIEQLEQRSSNDTD